MKKVIVLFSLIIIFNFISASFEIGNISHSIDLQYSSLDKIKGWMNISLNDESIDSLFEDSFGNSISLIDLLKADEAVYTCNTGGCLPTYEESNPENTKSFSLNLEESKIIGFKITEDINSISSITFDVESDAGESCSNQLEINFLEDNETEIKNNKISNSYCPSSKNYGCFTGETTSLAEIDSEDYCQRINLSESPGFEIGAWVKESVAGNKKLSMTLYNKDRDYIESCDLPTATSTGGEIGCEIDYLNSQIQEYYVCLSSSGSTGEYYTRGYPTNSGCGYQGYPTTQTSENFAYQIFSQGKKFGNVGTLTVSNSLGEDKTISEIVDEYINTKYGAGDCSSGCVIPIEFNSNMNQNIVLKNLLINYDLGGGLIGSTDKFYDLDKNSPTINSDFQKINLDLGNFSTPRNEGEETFRLKLDGEEVFYQEIKISSAPVIQNLNPKSTAAAVPTEFTLIISSNVSKYKWDFGDGTILETTTNKITHTYSDIKTYDLKVTITDDSEISSSMTFKIYVSSPEQAINSTLRKKSGDLENIDMEMEKFYFKDNLKSVLNFEKLQSDLDKIEQDYKKASSQENYKKIMIELLGIEVPETIYISEEANMITFYPKKNNINLDIIKEVAGGTYEASQKDTYKDGLISWNQENIDSKVSFNEFSASYGNFDERAILRTFEFEIDKKNGGEAYFVIKNLNGLKFQGDYSVREESGYSYVLLEEEVQTIIFTATENVNFIDVPVFITPGLNKLKLAEKIEEGEEGNFKWLLFIFILVLLLIIGVVVYVILQEWYKRKYENYLFKNRNDLYNLMVYITEERKKGTEYKEIGKKLRKAGWNSEQVTYVLRKHAGKRTGMFEIISLGKKKQMNQKPSGKRHLVKNPSKVKSK